MKRPIFDSLVETASDHHGYVTTLQARAAGLDPTQLRLLARSGRLEHVARGVYRVPVLPRSEHDDLAFAIAWARGRAGVSYESALVLHGLSNVNPSVVHLTAPPDNYPRAQGSGLVRIHRRHLPVNDVTVVDGLPVTTVARTIVDCQELGRTRPNCAWPSAMPVSPANSRRLRLRRSRRSWITAGYRHE